MKIVRELVPRVIDLKWRNLALIAAAENGKTDVVKELLARNADIETRNDSGATPLILAVRRGKGEVAEALLSAGSDVHAKDRGGRTALKEAIARGDLKIAEELLRRGAGSSEDLRAGVIEADKAGQRAW